MGQSRKGGLSLESLSKKTIYGRIKVYDMASIEAGDMKNDCLPAKQLQQMRLSDAFLLVLDNFRQDVPGDPVSLFHSIFSEFMLADMVQIENRLERIEEPGGKREDLHPIKKKDPGRVSRPSGARKALEQSCP